MASDNEPPELDETTGGLGGRSERDASGLTKIKEARLEQLAVEQEWDIPREGRSAVVLRQIEIATDPRYEPKEATNAAKCLAGMNAQNMERHKVAEPERGTTINIQHNGGNLSLNERSTRLTDLIATLRDRAGEGGDRATINAPADPQSTVPQPPAD